MKLLPDVLVYHYFGWEFNTQNDELPERFIELDFPSGIKNLLWYDDLHDDIIHKVAKTSDHVLNLLNSAKKIN